MPHPTITAKPQSSEDDSLRVLMSGESRPRRMQLFDEQTAEKISVDWMEELDPTEADIGAIFEDYRKTKTKESGRFYQPQQATLTERLQPAVVESQTTAHERGTLGELPKRPTVPLDLPSFQAKLNELRSTEADPYFGQLLKEGDKLARDAERDPRKAEVFNDFLKQHQDALDYYRTVVEDLRQSPKDVQDAAAKQNFISGLEDAAKVLRTQIRPLLEKANALDSETRLARAAGYEALALPQPKLTDEQKQLVGDRRLLQEAFDMSERTILEKGRITDFMRRVAQRPEDFFPLLQYINPILDSSTMSRINDKLTKKEPLTPGEDAWAKSMALEMAKIGLVDKSAGRQIAEIFYNSAPYMAEFMTSFGAGKALLTRAGWLATEGTEAVAKGILPKVMQGITKTMIGGTVVKAAAASIINVPALATGAYQRMNDYYPELTQAAIKDVTSGNAAEVWTEKGEQAIKIMEKERPGFLDATVQSWLDQFANNFGELSGNFMAPVVKRLALARLARKHPGVAIEALSKLLTNEKIEKQLVDQVWSGTLIETGEEYVTSGLQYVFGLISKDDLLKQFQPDQLVNMVAAFGLMDLGFRGLPAMSQVVSIARNKIFGEEGTEPLTQPQADWLLRRMAIEQVEKVRVVQPPVTQKAREMFKFKEELEAERETRAQNVLAERRRQAALEKVPPSDVRGVEQKIEEPSDDGNTPDYGQMRTDILPAFGEKAIVNMSDVEVRDKWRQLAKLPPTSEAKATYAYTQQTKSGKNIPLFLVDFPGHPKDGSHVSAGTLKKIGLPVPKVTEAEKNKAVGAPTESIRALAEKIASGAKDFTDTELQLRISHHGEVEDELRKKKTEKVVPLPPEKPTWKSLGIGKMDAEYYQSKGLMPEDIQKQMAVSRETPEEEKAIKPSAQGEIAGRQIREVSLTDVDVDAERFQPREGLDEEVQKERAASFVRAKTEENPIIVWRDPKDDRFKVLAGHHRYDLFQRVGEKSIPVIEFKGTEAEAIERARTENTERVAQTPLENAGQIRRKRESGILEAELTKESRRLFGRESGRVIALSYLNPVGHAATALRAMQKAQTQSQMNALTMAEWVGKTRLANPELSDIHEDEIFDFLQENYGRAALRTVTQFIDRVELSLDKRKAAGDFSPDAPLNIKSLVSKSRAEQQLDEDLGQAHTKFSDAREDLKIELLRSGLAKEAVADILSDKLLGIDTRRMHLQELAALVEGMLSETGQANLPASAINRLETNLKLKPKIINYKEAQEEYDKLDATYAEKVKKIRATEIGLFDFEGATDEQIKNTERDGERRSEEEIAQVDPAIEAIESEARDAGTAEQADRNARNADELIGQIAGTEIVNGSLENFTEKYLERNDIERDSPEYLEALRDVDGIILQGYRDPQEAMDDAQEMIAAGREREGVFTIDGLFINYRAIVEAASHRGAVPEQMYRSALNDINAHKGILRFDTFQWGTRSQTDAIINRLRDKRVLERRKIGYRIDRARLREFLSAPKSKLPSQIIREQQELFNYDTPQSETTEGPRGERVRFQSASRTKVQYAKRSYRESGEFAHRLFAGHETIRDNSDVAYIFRTLETEGTEHAFFVGVDREGKIRVQYLSSGTFNSSLVPGLPILHFIRTFGIKNGWFVHNHPSGNLIPSGEDMRVLSNLRELAGIEIEGIIIDVREGRFGTFSREEGRAPRRSKTIPVSVLTFSKLEYLKNLDELVSVNGPADVAKFILGTRFGSGRKLVLVSLNPTNHIVGAFILRNTFGTYNVLPIAREIAEHVAESGGTAAVLVGNANPDNAYLIQQVSSIKDILRDNVAIHDYIGVEPSADTYVSAVDRGLLKELSQEYSAQKLNEEQRGLWADRFEDLLKSKFGLNADEALAVRELTDARAQAWAEAEGKPIAEWYQRHIADIRRGPPTAEVLKQTASERYQRQERVLEERTEKERELAELITRQDQLRRELAFAQEKGIKESIGKAGRELESANKRIGTLNDELKRLQTSMFEGGQETLFQGWTTIPPFFSGLQKLIEQKMPNRASAEQIRNIVREAKKEEVQWTGLDEFLWTKANFTKQEILDFLKENEIVVEEVVKGETINTESKYAIPEVLKAAREVGGTEGDLLLTLENDGDAYRALTKKFPELKKADGEEGRPHWAQIVAQDVFGGESKDVKFSQWQLPGAKEGTYKELLLTLPTRRVPETYWAEQHGNYFEVRNDRTRDLILPTWATREQAEKTANALNKEWQQLGGREDVRFVSGHFDEPNVFAHIRFNERTDAEGNKVLFIEEIQSDWAQKGRREGFRTGQRPSGWVTAYLGDGRFSVRDAQGNEVAIEEAESSQQAIDQATGIRGEIPQLPFAKNWHEIAMRRMVRWAAENGFDSIAWTTGEQQSKRYDLSKQVDEIKAQRLVDNKDGKLISSENYAISVKLPDGTRQDLGDFAGSKLPDVVGKGLAEKIIAEVIDPTKPKTYSGLDLKVGGEGMKGFYDKILVDYANKFGKKFGARVGGLTIETGARRWSVDSSPIEGEFRVADPYGQTIETGFPTVQSAMGFIARNATKTVHSLPITPSMRDAALRTGFPLFQGPKGAVQFLSDGRAIIHALEQPDVSTVLHELFHIFRRDLTEEQNRIVEDWAGVRNGNWTRETEEKWARAGERYLREGRAPTPKLQPLFERLKRWLEKIYQQIVGSPLDVKISNEVRKVFDELFVPASEHLQEHLDKPAITQRIDELRKPHEVAAYSTSEDLRRISKDQSFPREVREAANILYQDGLENKDYKDKNLTPEERSKFLHDTQSLLKGWKVKLGGALDPNKTKTIKMLASPQRVGIAHPEFGRVYGAIDLAGRMGYEREDDIFKAIDNHRAAEALPAEERAGIAEAFIDAQIGYINPRTLERRMTKERGLRWKDIRRLAPDERMLAELRRESLKAEIASILRDADTLENGRLPDDVLRRVYGLSDQGIEVYRMYASVIDTQWRDLLKDTMQQRFNYRYADRKMRDKIDEYIEKEMGFLLDNYFPLTRPHGEWVVTTKEGDKPFMTAVSRRDADDLKERWEEEGIKEVEVHLKRALPEEYRRRLGYWDIYELAEEAGVDADDPTIKKLVDELKSRSMDRHFIQRKGVPGLDATWENYKKIFDEYTVAATRRWAKSMGYNDGQQALKLIDRNAKPGLYAYAADWLNDSFLSSKDQWEALRAILATWHLSFNPNFVLMQMTQVPILGEIVLGNYADQGVRPEAIIAKALPKAPRYMLYRIAKEIENNYGKKHPAWVKLAPYATRPEWLTTELQEALEIMDKQRVANAGLTEAMFGRREYQRSSWLARNPWTLSGEDVQKIEKAIDITKDVLQFTTSMTERANRIAGFLAGWYAGEQMAISTDERLRYEFAVNVTNDINIKYAQINFPLIFKKLPKTLGFRGAARTAFLFQYFPLYFYQAWTRNVMNAVRRKDGKLLARTILPQAAFTGLKGLPYYWLMSILWGFLFDDDPEVKSRIIASESGIPVLETQEAQDIFWRGIPTLAGVDMSVSVGVEEPPYLKFFQPNSLLGVGGSDFKNVQTAFELAREGRQPEAIFRVLPTGLKAPLRALYELKNGIRTIGGDVIHRPTVGQALLRMLNVQSVAVSMAYLYHHELANIQRKRSERFSNYNRRIMNAIRDNDENALQKALQDIDTENKDRGPLEQYRVDDNLPYILNMMIGRDEAGDIIGKPIETIPDILRLRKALRPKNEANRPPAKRETTDDELQQIMSGKNE